MNYVIPWLPSSSSEAFKEFMIISRHFCRTSLLVVGTDFFSTFSSFTAVSVVLDFVDVLSDSLSPLLLPSLELSLS